MRVQFSAGADRLTWAYPKLSRQLKKCAAYILEHPSEVATLSMRQVAARADVPPSTMNRLARALGFGTYNEFRALYRDSMNEQSAGLFVRDGTAQRHRARERIGPFPRHVPTGGDRQYQRSVRPDRPGRAGAGGPGAGGRAQRARCGQALVSLLRQPPALRDLQGDPQLAPPGPAQWRAFLSLGGPRLCGCDHLHRHRPLRGRHHQSCPARPGRPARGWSASPIDAPPPWRPVPTTSCSFPSRARACSRPISARQPLSKCWPA